jgi:hypothetical protein
MKPATKNAAIRSDLTFEEPAEADNIYMASIYRLTAVNFEQSAKTLSQTLEVNEQGRPMKLTALPFYFLVSHATELFLKSALLKRGASDKELRRRYRHNLAALLTALLNEDVVVTPQTVGLVQQLSGQHATSALRYSALVDNGQAIYLPPPQLLLEMLKELLLLTRTPRPLSSKLSKETVGA